MSITRTLARNAAIVGGATLLSRILGFVRDLVVAFALGAGLPADAFFVAFRMPNLLRRLFAEGSLTMAFIPIFSRIREKQGDEEAFALARSIQVWVLILLGIIVSLVMVGAEGLTMLIAPGFADNPEQFALTVDLVRICFPYILFISSVALTMGVLNSMNHFLMPAMAPCALNVVLILFALVGYFSGGNVAVFMSWGVLAGGLVQFVMQIPALRARGFHWKGPWSLNHPGTRRVGKLMLPTVFGAAVYQVNIVMGTLLASFLPVGSISYLYYADRLVQFPLGVFGLAVSTAALPSLARLAAEKNREEFGRTLDMSLGLTWFISTPSAAGLMGLSTPIISILFHRGAFDGAAVEATSSALVAYGIGLPAIALVRPIVSAFYAMEDSRTPVRIAFFCMLMNVGLGALLMQTMAHVGLAMAVSVSGWLNFMLLAHAMRKKRGQPLHLLRSAAISAVLSAIVGCGAHLLALYSPALALFSIPLWGVFYIGSAYLLKLPEACLLVDIAGDKIRRRLKA